MYSHRYGYEQPVQYPSYYGSNQHVSPPPHQPPVYHPEITFKSDYLARLAELTANSRPIIQALTMTAQDYTQYSEIISECIETHIKRAPTWMKLPAFYLLDAISKNIYVPYAHHFAQFVVPLYLDAYHEVDPSTQSKMKEMLLTWRHGSPRQTELFGRQAQQDIERAIWGGRDSASGAVSGPSHVNAAQVISELEFTLSQKERASQANPYDPTLKKHINVLQQLHSLVINGVSQDELNQILTQLRALSQAAIPPPIPQARPPPSASFGSSNYPNSHSNLPPPPPHTASIDSPKPKPAALPGIPDISGLYANLLKAGLVLPTTQAPEVKPVDPVREAQRRYRRDILNQKVVLSSSGLTRSRPQIVGFLFDNLPVQCKQCGLRFPDDKHGKSEMQDHMDMHFRQNRKANLNMGRGHSRSWFISLEDWINENGKGKGQLGGSSLLAKEVAAAEKAKVDAELRAQYVVVPPGEEAKQIACPICKELLHSEFLEDDEEWVWKNAVMKDGKIYHATCHAEAAASTSSLAARFRNGGRSRSGTPDASTPLMHKISLPDEHSPSKLATVEPTVVKTEEAEDAEDTRVAGTKRKADSEDAFSGDGSPLPKKIAIS